MKTEISIIIPVYNSEKYIKKCLDSIINQTYTNYEVICVDDGSKDSSSEILSEYANKYERIRVISKVNGGQASARNVGLDAAQGQYITFIDADDWIAPSYLEALLGAIINDEVDVAICSSYRVFPNGQLKEFYVGVPTGVYTDAEQVLQNVSLVPWGKLYKKDLFDNKRFPLLGSYEDFSFVPQIIIDANRISVLEQKLYYYYWNAASTTLSKIVDDNIPVAFSILREKLDGSRLINIYYIKMMLLVYLKSLIFDGRLMDAKKIYRDIPKKKNTLWKTTFIESLSTRDKCFLCACKYRLWVIVVILAVAEFKLKALYRKVLGRSLKYKKGDLWQV